MGTIQSIPISFITLLLLLAPGLIGLRILYFYSKRKFSLTRTRLIVYSSFLSGISVLILYASSNILFQNFIPVIGVIASTLNISRESKIMHIPLWGLVGLYILHISVVIVIGAAVGLGYRKYKWHWKDQILDRRDPWEYTFTESPTDGEWIEVKLQSGDIVQGKFNDRAFNPAKRELFLDDPFQVEYPSPNKEAKRYDMGRSIYLHSGAIQQAVTLQEDPNAKTSENIRDHEIDQSLEDEIDDSIRDLENQGRLSDFKSSSEKDN